MKVRVAWGSNWHTEGDYWLVDVDPIPKYVIDFIREDYDWEIIYQEVDMNVPEDLGRIKELFEAAWNKQIEEEEMKEYEEKWERLLEISLKYQCQHDSDGMVYYSSPPQNKCKKCGVFYR